MTLDLASLLKRITRRDAGAPKTAVVPVEADPLDRLARIVRVERAREAANPQGRFHHQAG